MESNSRNSLRRQSVEDDDDDDEDIYSQGSLSDDDDDDDDDEQDIAGKEKVKLTIIREDGSEGEWHDDEEDPSGNQGNQEDSFLDDK